MPSEPVSNRPARCGNGNSASGGDGARPVRLADLWGDTIKVPTAFRGAGAFSSLANACLFAWRAIRPRFELTLAVLADLAGVVLLVALLLRLRCGFVVLVRRNGASGEPKRGERPDEATPRGGSNRPRQMDKAFRVHGVPFPQSACGLARSSTPRSCRSRLLAGTVELRI